jgi:glutamate-5-semialdehyde dehydrogenase
MTVQSLDELGARAKFAARSMQVVSSAEKHDALAAAASALEQNSEAILAANASDVARAQDAGIATTVIDRLRLDGGRIRQMADSMRSVASLPDPVGEIVEGRVLPNGLQVRRVRVPLGVIGIVYENRPNVTADAAALCIRSGNAVLLRGSAGAIASNRAIADAIRSGLSDTRLPADAVQIVEDTRHETVVEFVKLRGFIDCLIPRGGPSLVQLVVDEAKVPFVIDGDGNCHVFVDESADLDMAERIIVNAKTQRPSVCNAMETLLVHEAIAKEALPRFASALQGVELVGDEETMSILPGIAKASEEDYATEFLALKLAIGVVADLDAAIAHVTRYSSGHSEAIVTNDRSHARRFIEEVDAAAVLVNASTRFVDGGELGLGAEIGISTQKLHARGPMGLRELTTLKYVIEGDGQIRL